MCECDPSCGPPASGADVRKIDKPNPVPLPPSEWNSVTIKYPSVVLCMGTDPGGDLVAVPEMEKNSTTEVYKSIGTGADRALYLHAPGTWRIRNTGAVGITGLVVDTYDAIGALMYGGVKVGGGLVNIGTSAPGTFTPTHVTEETVDAASETVLAAGAYKHVYFRNTGATRITICGAGIVAVDKVGWVLGPDPAGNGYGEIIAWNHPDVMPVGAFTAISSAAGGKLIVSAGT